MTRSTGKTLVIAGFLLLDLVIISTVLSIFVFSHTVQRISPYPLPMRQMTGELGTPLGEPVKAVLFSRKGVIAEKDGVLFVDPSVQYPLQIRTILLVSGGLGAGCILFVILPGLLILRGKPPSPS